MTLARMVAGIGSTAVICLPFVGAAQPRSFAANTAHLIRVMWIIL
jgi:hypothetical protein